MLEEFRRQNKELINPPKIKAGLISAFLTWTGVLLVGSIILLVINPYLPENIISDPPLRLDGLLIVSWMIFCLIRLEKGVLPKLDTNQITYGSLIGGLSVFCGELIFQGIRQFTFEGYSLMERIEIFSRSVIGMTIFAYNKDLIAVKAIF